MEKNQSFDVFISYNWSLKDKVKKLCDHLNDLNYKVWRDDRELSTCNKSLTAQLANGIKRSKIFLSFITSDYCKSYNCNLEIEFANALAKPMIALMIDRLAVTEIHEIPITGRNQTSGIGFIIT